MSGKGSSLGVRFLAAVLVFIGIVLCLTGIGAIVGAPVATIGGYIWLTAWRISENPGRVFGCFGVIIVIIIIIAIIIISKLSSYASCV